MYSVIKASASFFLKTLRRSTKVARFDLRSPLVARRSPYFRCVPFTRFGVEDYFQQLFVTAFAWMTQITVVEKTISNVTNECYWIIAFLHNRFLVSQVFRVVPFADVETVRSLVEEMETDSRDEKTDDDPGQQGIGKRVIGELLAKKRPCGE